MTRSFAVVTFGCRVNQADSLQLERELREAGLAAADATRADVVIVNTCSVTASADQGARQVVRRIHRDNPDAPVVITGCYATREQDEVRALPGVAAVIDNQHKSSVVRQVLDLVRPASPPQIEGPCGATFEPGIAGRTAWTLSVQTGCEQACRYCVIPLTRGASRSRPLADVLNEVDRVARAGFAEVAIAGVHLGSWGRDLHTGQRLIDLLRALDGHAAPVMYRISSLEPMDCTPEVRALLTASHRIAPHFHLPLQHASDRVLSAMARPYTRGYYEELVAWICEQTPHASIGSDVLVGFPGELDDDHDQNVAFLERSPLTHLHVFPYSDRPGTAASRMPTKIHGSVIRARAEAVRAVGRRLQERFRARMVGTIRPGLTLEDGTLVVTDNYLKVRVPPGLPRNVRVRVSIERGLDPLQGQVVGLAG